MPLLTGLNAYYNLNEASGNALDSLLTYDLTDNGGVGTRSGKVATARNFTGAENLSSTDAVFSPGDTDFSFAGWFNLDDLGTSQTIFGKWDGGGGGTQQEYLLYWEPGTSKLTWLISSDGSDSGNVAVEHSTTILAATWYFFVAYHNASGDVIGLALNGGAGEETAAPSGVYQGTEPFRVGTQGNGSPLVGGVDELGYWAKVLDGTEDSQLYNGGAGATYPFVVVSTKKFPAPYLSRRAA